MEFKGTKGNWILRENQCTIMSNENCLIARVFDGKGSALLENKEQSKEIVYANAKLIASAPELLEACESMLKAFNNAPKDWLMTSEVMYAEKQMVNAIAKALQP